MPDKHPADLLTIPQAAHAANVSVPTIRRRIRDGLLPAYYVAGRNVRIRRRELEATMVPVPVPTAGRVVAAAGAAL
jgi:excisionase family DNA binding protein